MRRIAGRMVAMALIASIGTMAGCGGDGGEEGERADRSSGATQTGAVGGLSHGAQVTPGDSATTLDANGNAVVSATGAADNVDAKADANGAAMQGDDAAAVSGNAPGAAPQTYRVDLKVEGLADGRSMKLFINHDEMINVGANGTHSAAAKKSTKGTFDVSVAIHPRGQLCRVEAGAGFDGLINPSSFVVRCETRKQFGLATTWPWGLASFVLDGERGGISHAPGRRFHTVMPLFHPAVMRHTNRGFFMRPVLFGVTLGPSVPLEPGTLGTFKFDRDTGELDIASFHTIGLSSERAISEYILDAHGGLAFLEGGHRAGLMHVDMNKGDLIPHMFSTSIENGTARPGPTDCDIEFARSPVSLGRLHKGFENMRLTPDERFAFALTCEEGKPGQRLTTYRLDHSHDRFAGRHFEIHRLDQTDPRFNTISVAGFDINPQRTLLLASDAAEPLLHILRIDRVTGQLTPVKGSPFAHHKAAGRVKVNRDGTAVYLVHEATSGITAMLIDEKTGAAELIAGTPFITGEHPTTIAIDASDSYAYVPYRDIGAIVVFKIDPRTKALTRDGWTMTRFNVDDMFVTED